MSAEVTKLPVVQQQAGTALQINNFSELMQAADFLSKSQLIPASIRGKPADVAIILQTGLEVGIPPMQALNGIDVIQGKIAISPQLGLALVRSRVPNALITTEADKATMTVKVTMARDKNDPSTAYTAVWDMARAQKMGLTGKDNYQKQPLTMLQWRATMDALRMVFPDVLKGLAYSPDEAEEIADEGGTKAAAITEALAKTERVVTSEVVVDATPEVLPPEELPPATEDPVGGYVLDLKFGKENAGKTLAELGPEKCKAIGEHVRGWFAKEGKPIRGAWLEALTRIDQFIESSASKTQAEPDFGSFNQ
jgi:hypothetical protein